MITIQEERCDGCGVCVDVCPNGAIYLVDGRAALDERLCRDCEACVAACPVGAIVAMPPLEAPRAGAPQPQARPMPVPVPQPAPIQVREKSTPVPFRTRVLPVVGAALAWAGREILPRLADQLLVAMDRRALERQSLAGLQSTQASTVSTLPSNGTQARGGGGRRRRRRRRGG
jgi:NAD-dependent dihydropyrimidine dehydrogenase PreA subunit